MWHRNTLWKNLWILQGLNFVEKSQNLEPVKKPVNFKTCEKTYEKTCEQNMKKFEKTHEKTFEEISLFKHVNKPVK